MRKLTLAGALGAALLLAGCSENESRAAVEANGFTNVVYVGAAWWGCGEHDTFRHRFTATGATGKRVEVLACGGFLKGWTVRITKVLP